MSCLPASMSSDAEIVLGESITRLLGDKLYDKRKQAALEIEGRVKDALSRSVVGGTSRIQRILDSLHREYIQSTLVNNRKGGLIGLASVAIGLGSDIPPFLEKLVNPVLGLFNDSDERVRYYACEALYNVSKVANESVLAHFNEIFDGLCKLYSDVDTEVKNGAQVLDRLMKDIVTQHPGKFRIDDFIPLVGKRMQFRNPFIRQLVLAWITLLLKVQGKKVDAKTSRQSKRPPAVLLDREGNEVDMLGYLPAYLEGLFQMLGDQSRDIRHSADACLNELLAGVKKAHPTRSTVIFSEIAPGIVKTLSQGDPCSKLTGLCWLHEFVHSQLLASQSQKDWSLSEVWYVQLPIAVIGTLWCLDDTEDEVARMAVELNNGFLEMVRYLGKDMPAENLIDALLKCMSDNKASMVVRTACLQWMCMLLVHSPKHVVQTATLTKLFALIFETLLHPDDEVVVAALRVLAQIMEGRTMDDKSGISVDGNDAFTVVTTRLLRLFAEDRNMFESKGRLMIRQLCGHLDPRRLYITVARSIKRETDRAFAQQMVQIFNWILLTASETKALREELLSTTLHMETPRGGSRTSLFQELLEPWFHNPVSALALSLWAQQYELAIELTARIASFEPTLDLLTQLDQLVHLLESPVFARLRLKLLEPRRNPALVKCLLGLAMLLPQAAAFKILRDRLQVVQSGLLLEGHLHDPPPQAISAKADTQGLRWWAGPRPAQLTDDSGVATAAAEGDLNSLLERFDTIASASTA